MQTCEGLGVEVHKNQSLWNNCSRMTFSSEIQGPGRWSYLPQIQSSSGIQTSSSWSCSLFISTILPLQFSLSTKRFIPVFRVSSIKSYHVNEKCDKIERTYLKFLLCWVAVILIIDREMKLLSFTLPKMIIMLFLVGALSQNCRANGLLWENLALTFIW